jgi:hypothetical protein
MQTGFACFYFLFLFLTRGNNSFTLKGEKSMSNRQPLNTSYGLSQAIIPNSPSPIISKRAPLTSDLMQLGTIWCDTPINSVYILASIVNNLANWILVAAGGAAGIFTSLIVAPGPIALTGTTGINAAGAAVTNIGTAPGTGVVNIGNTTGGIDTNGTITMTTGNLNLTVGDIVLNGAGQDVEVQQSGAFIFNGGAYVVYHATDPNGVVAALKGSLCLVSSGTGVGDRMWVNTDGLTTWTAVTTAA